MTEMEWRRQIRENLKATPINHETVLTIQVVIPESELKLITPDRKEDLVRSFKEYQSNLIPVILRRTNPYSQDSKAQQYEVIYGSEWVVIAKELEIEKLWAWIFDLNDEQAKIIKSEMKQLVGIQEFHSEINYKNLEQILDKKIEPITKTLNNFFERLNKFSEKMDQVISCIDPPKLNLQTATQAEIDQVLEQAKVKNETHRYAAIKAVQYWKDKNDLSFENLKKSTQKGEHKQLDFGKRTYDKLEQYFKL